MPKCVAANLLTSFGVAAKFLPPNENDKCWAKGIDDFSSLCAELVSLYRGVMSKNAYASF